METTIQEAGQTILNIFIFGIGIIGVVYLIELLDRRKIKKLRSSFHKWSNKDLTDYLAYNQNMDSVFYAICEEIESREKMQIDDDSYIRAKTEQPVDYIKGSTHVIR